MPSNIALALQEMAVELTALKPLPGNPRRGNVEAVKRSLLKFGQRKPIVAQADGTVIAGNHTLAAAAALGWSHLAVVVTNDDDATAKAYALADNRTSALGTFDIADLADMVASLMGEDPDLLLAASFNDAEIASLLNVPNPEVAEDQPALDQPHTVTCPECGTEFVP
jgi:ParB-like chromosome segregation protein Spo0J